MNQWIGETFESSTTTQNESFTQNISFVAVDIACHWLQSCGLATSALFPASAPYIEAHSDYWTLIKRRHQPPLDNIFSHSVLAPLLGTRSRYASLGVCFLLTSWSLLISNYKFCHGMCAWLPVKIYQKYILFHFYLTLCIPTEDAQGSLLDGQPGSWCWCGLGAGSRRWVRVLSIPGWQTRDQHTATRN